MMAIGGPGTSDLVVADPERDRVSLIQSGQTRTIELESGDQPFRLTRDASGAVYVILRGKGEVAKLDLADAAVTARFRVCAEPRGIDYDAFTGDLVVACAEGKLVRFKPEATAVHSELSLKPDLRDVVIQGNRTYVSRFRSAEVLFIENDKVTRTVRPPQLSVQAPSDFRVRTMAPAVAWRMIGDPLGGVIISHQLAVVEAIGVDPHESGDEKIAQISPVTATVTSSYAGSGSGCDAIVQTALTQVDFDGNARSSAPVTNAVLPVDLAVSKDGSTIALASAGSRDPEMPQRHFEFVGGPGSGDNADVLVAPAPPGLPQGGVQLLNRFEFQFSEGSEVLFPGECSGQRQVGGGPTTSVVFTQENQVVAFQRMPATLSTIDPEALTLVSSEDLGGAPTLDTGHEIFHRDSGGGLACASCHPEATDDGHVWVFSDVGPRRTQHLGIPLAGTAPFHWDGSLPTLNSLMDEVFVERMGGVFQDPDRLESLENWMFARPERRIPAADADAAARGEALFQSKETACATCHAGKKFTDNRSYSVGTTSKSKPLQVPSLQGLLLRPPYMHDGCAQTLHERFTEACGGGDAHGNTSHLAPNQIDDLVEYLGTL
jgi:hypothetical protein